MRNQNTEICKFRNTVWLVMLLKYVMVWYYLTAYPASLQCSVLKMWAHILNIYNRYTRNKNWCSQKITWQVWYCMVWCGMVWVGYSSIYVVYLPRTSHSTCKKIICIKGRVQIKIAQNVNFFQNGGFPSCGCGCIYGTVMLVRSGKVW